MQIHDVVRVNDNDPEYPGINGVIRSSNTQGYFNVELLSNGHVIEFAEDELELVLDVSPVSNYFRDRRPTSA